MKRTLGIALALILFSASQALAEIQVTQTVYPDNKARVTLQISFPSEVVSQVMNQIALVGGADGQDLRTEVETFFAGSNPDPYASPVVDFLAEFGNALAGDIYVAPSESDAPNIFRNSVRGWSDSLSYYLEIVYLIRDINAFGQNNGFSTFLTDLQNGFSYTQNIVIPGNQVLSTDYPSLQMYLQENSVNALRAALIRANLQNISTAIGPSDEDLIKQMLAGVLPVFTKIRHTIVLPGNVTNAEGAMRREGRQAEWNVELEPYYQGQPLVFMAECSEILPETLAEKATFDTDMEQAIKRWDDIQTMRASRAVGGQNGQEPQTFNPQAPGAALANLGYDALRRKDFNTALQYYDQARLEDSKYQLGFEIAQFCAENVNKPRKGVSWLSKIRIQEGKPTLGEYFEWDVPQNSFAATHMPAAAYQQYGNQRRSTNAPAMPVPGR